MIQEFTKRVCPHCFYAVNSTWSVCLFQFLTTCKTQTFSGLSPAKYDRHITLFDKDEVLGTAREFPKRFKVLKQNVTQQSSSQTVVWLERAIPVSDVRNEKETALPWITSGSWVYSVCCHYQSPPTITFLSINAAIIHDTYRLAVAHYICGPMAWQRTLVVLSPGACLCTERRPIHSS